MYSICNPLIFIVRKNLKNMISSSKIKKRPTYLLILKLMDRSIANKDIFKDGLSLAVSKEKKLENVESE